MKLLFYILIGLFLLYALPFVVARVVEVSTSDYGFWTEYPHSGFCPDAPLENNAAPSAREL